MALGLAPELCRQLTEQINADDDGDNNWRQAMALLADWVPVADDEILNNGGVVALVGPTGVGKTTTVAKLAARFALRHGARQVALISTDNYRIGAHEQLLTYGRIARRAGADRRRSGRIAHPAARHGLKRNWC